MHQEYTMRPAFVLLRGLVAILAVLFTLNSQLLADQVRWGRGLLRQPSDWYASEEAQRIADNVVLWQRDNGGWPKNVNMAEPLDELARTRLLRQKGRDDSTFDNNATHTQMRFLAKVYNALSDDGAAENRDDYKQAFLRGLEHIFEAQYDNGGWPQQYPLRDGYSDHITYNDGAMIGVMRIMRDIVKGHEDFAFVEGNQREQARKSFEKGIQAILDTQIIVDGKRTVWCAQHDAATLEPALARSYELPSFSGGESVGVVKFLMELDDPSPEVVDAVKGAVKWFRGAKIEGLRERRVRSADAIRGFDKVHVADADAPPLWARFYELETQRPIFVDRDGVPKYSIDEIGEERRTGYAWVGSWPQNVLNEYPKWREKHSH